MIDLKRFRFNKNRFQFYRLLDIKGVATAHPPLKQWQSPVLGLYGFLKERLEMFIRIEPRGTQSETILNWRTHFFINFAKPVFQHHP